MELWIPITLFAAFMQNLRSATQKHLKARLSDTGASLARFLFAAPLAGVYVAALAQRADVAVPVPHMESIALCMGGGVAQILATVMLVRLFGYRNFTVGTTFSKTESLQAAAFGFVFLGETMTGGAILGILVSVVGVAIISKPTGARPWQRPDSSILLGIGAGAMFGISAVAFRAASLSLSEGDVWVRAAVTLLCVTVLQTLMMTAWMNIREPGEIRRVIAAWRVAGLVGVTGVLGSIGWFTAMTLQNAAYVRALGQVELVFAFAASWLLFRERATATEISGIALVVAGILLLLLLR